MSEPDEGWEEIQKAAREGRFKDIRILLTPTHEIKPKRGPGRPRTRGPLKYGHYKGSKTGKRPKCRRWKCTNYLKRDQSIACSVDCLRALFEASEEVWEGMAHDAEAYVKSGDVRPSEPLFQIAREGETGERYSLRELLEELRERLQGGTA